MHRTYQAATSEKRAKNSQHERGKDQPHVPGFHHAAFFLHHYGVQKSGAGNHGINEAFSTGSHAQYPPQPNTE